MDKKEAILQLESLRADCEEFESVNPTEKDVQALEIALAALKETAQEVPVQEQFEENFNPETGIKLYDVCPKCWVKGDIPYQCGFSKCPGYKLLTKEINNLEIFL